VLSRIRDKGWLAEGARPPDLSIHRTILARRPIAQAPVRAFAPRPVERPVARRRCTDKGDTDAEDV
jgi:hypothetical protein